MSADVLASIQRHVQCARLALDGDDAPAGAFFLRRAETEARGIGSDDGAFPRVLDLRNELECHLLAAEQLHEAGVEAGVVVAVLHRGVVTADGILGRLAVTTGA